MLKDRDVARKFAILEKGNSRVLAPWNMGGVRPRALHCFTNACRSFFCLFWLEPKYRKSWTASNVMFSAHISGCFVSAKAPVFFLQTRPFLLNTRTLLSPGATKNWYIYIYIYNKRCCPWHSPRTGQINDLVDLFSMLENLHFELFCHHLKKTIQFAVFDNLSHGSKRSRRQSSWKVEATFNSGVRGHQHSIFDISPLGIESTFWPSYTFTQPSLHQKHVHTPEKSRDNVLFSKKYMFFRNSDFFIS